MSGTWVDLVHKVAKEHGQRVSEAEADHILWEHTGFPSFWEGDPRSHFTAQLHEFFGREVGP